jgi:LPXTG-motif cell wall-anchored protein
MKPQSQNARRSRVALISMSGVALAVSMFAFSAQADEWDKLTILTINEPIQVTNTVLPAGQYAFKLINSESDRHIVEIYNADRTHLITTVMAIPNYRIQPTGGSRFMMWETPAGSPKALRAWFYPGDNFGQEFPYPKNIQQVSTTQTASTTPAPPVEPTPAQPEPAPVAQVEPAPAAPAPEPQVEQQQEVVVAQNTPPPAPVTVPEQPVPEATTPAPAELPKTGTPYPMFGLIGLLALGVGAFVRKQVA